MTEPAAGFDQFVVQWKERLSTPVGRLFYSTAHLNLHRHLAERPLRVLDIGGGIGIDARHLARQGHSVTLLDLSPAMLAEAQALAKAEGVGERLTCYRADIAALPHLFSEGQFELILCHLVLDFLPDPLRQLGEMCRLLAPGGCCSIIETNRYSDAYRLAFQADTLADALAAVGSTTYLHPWANRQVSRFSAEEIIDTMRGYDCMLLGHYGINVLKLLPAQRAQRRPRLLCRVGAVGASPDGHLSVLFTGKVLSGDYAALGRGSGIGEHITRTDYP